MKRTKGEKIQIIIIVITFPVIMIFLMRFFLKTNKDNLQCKDLEPYPIKSTQKIHPYDYCYTYSDLIIKNRQLSFKIKALEFKFSTGLEEKNEQERIKRIKRAMLVKEVCLFQNSNEEDISIEDEFKRLYEKNYERDSFLSNVFYAFFILTRKPIFTVHSFLDTNQKLMGFRVVSENKQETIFFNKELRPVSYKNNAGEIYFIKSNGCGALFIDKSKKISKKEMMKLLKENRTSVPVLYRKKEDNVKTY